MEWRTCQVLNDGCWVDIDFKAIKRGHIVRLFERDGEPVKGNQRETEFVAQNDAVPCEPEGNFSIEVLPCSFEEDLCGRKT